MTLDEAWAEAEAALPEGWRLSWAEHHVNQDESSEWEFAARGFTTLHHHPVRLAVAGKTGTGPTPPAALQALAAALRALSEPGGKE